MTVVMSVMLLVFIVFVLVFLCMPAHKTRRLNAHRERLAFLYADLHYLKPYTLFLPVLFMLKRIVFVATLPTEDVVL